jgi:prepilin-type N-terminal cleavage/methylation domain-containing protein
MTQKTAKNKHGFTLIELTIVMAIASIVFLSMGILLVDSQRVWSRMYDRVCGNMVSDGQVARRAFDAAVRKSSIARERLLDDEVEVYYYDDPDNSVMLDRFARFYADYGELTVDYGELNSNGNPHGPRQRVMLARNVESVNFSVAGACVQMILTLDNGSENLTVMTSAIRQNE